MKTKPIDHDASTAARQDSYEFAPTIPRLAAHLMKVADRLEAKEPLAWQPAGTIPIKELLRRES
jgi:hypothetical protein